MKTRNKTVKIALLLGIAAWTMSSCQDWLTVYPTNKVVEENFWEDRNDLDGVRYAAYQQMCRTLDKLVLWGDLRSDSYTQYAADADVSTRSLYQEIRDGRIERDSANAYFDWSGLYRTINYCNKVLQHGPEVLARDKQFTSAEWQQIRAEVTGLRALNYFYLIRAFKDVPYSTKVVNKDTEVQYFGATNQLIVLDSLITDLENVKGQARNRFSDIRDTKGLITNPAIYAMLSDMYLWRAALHKGRNITSDNVVINNIPSKMGTTESHTISGDYQKAIDYADAALAALAEQNGRGKNSTATQGFGSQTEMKDYGLTNCYLYPNDFADFTSGIPPTLSAFSRIFSGNSEESIFELQFSQSEGRSHSLNGTSTGGGIWSNGSYTHLAVSDGTLNNIFSENNSYLDRDSRLWFSAWNRTGLDREDQPNRFCWKWSNGAIGIVMPLSSYKCKDLSVTPFPSNSCNWIVYRISDVMLQKAEALVELGQTGEAMRYVNAINRRWYCNDDETNPGQPSEDVTGASGSVNKADDADNRGNLPNAGSAELAVLNERQLEFLGEGKRWFDLVRYAERHAYDAGDPLDERAYDARYSKDPNDTRLRSAIYSQDVCELAGTTNGITGVKAMVNNLMKGEWDNQKRKTLINRFKNRYGLYNLIYYKEIEASNGTRNNTGNKLEQNPVWNKTIYD